MRYSKPIILAAVLSLSSQSVLAAASKEENIGVGSGAVIGALAGGPVGFIIGAAIGAKLGDTMHQKSERIVTLHGSLQESEIAVAELESGIDNLSTEVEKLQNVARPELISLMQAGIDIDLLFRTDEFALTDATGDRLNQMAVMLATMPEIQVRLDGFADERGDETYNQSLSEKRVEFVRTLLVNAGVHPTRISSSAHGEAIAADSNVDSYALERRVSIKLYIDEAQSVAANPR